MLLLVHLPSSIPSCTLLAYLLNFNLFFLLLTLSSPHVTYRNLTHTDFLSCLPVQIPIQCKLLRLPSIKICRWYNSSGYHHQQRWIPHEYLIHQQLPTRLKFLNAQSRIVRLPHAVASSATHLLPYVVQWHAFRFALSCISDKSCISGVLSSLRYYESL